MRLVEAVGIRMQSLLSEYNVTKYKLAKDGGFPRQTIAEIIQAKNKTVSLNSIYQIIATLDITLEQFFADPIFKEVTD